MQSDLIAWASGLFEGEGSCGLLGGQRQPVAQLSMTDEDVVERFARIVGRGAVHSYRSNQRTTHGGQRKQQWRWSVQSAEDVGHVLGLLWPFLGERRKEQAYYVMERCGSIGDERGFCKNGHDLSDSTHCYLHRKTGKRHCRTCRTAYQRGWLARRGG